MSAPTWNPPYYWPSAPTMPDQPKQVRAGAENVTLGPDGWFGMDDLSIMGGNLDVTVVPVPNLGGSSEALPNAGLVPDRPGVYHFGVLLQLNLTELTGDLEFLGALMTGNWPGYETRYVPAGGNNQVFLSFSGIGAVQNMGGMMVETFFLALALRRPEYWGTSGIWAWILQLTLLQETKEAMEW